MIEHQDHIVKAYDDELKQLTRWVQEMGDHVLQQYDDAVMAMNTRDDALAARAFTNDNTVDVLEQQLNELALRMLALRQPMAGDLRLIIGAMRIARDLERIGDYAANLAKRARTLNAVPPLSVTNAVVETARLARPIIQEAVSSFIEKDSEKAANALTQDDLIDEAYHQLVRHLIAHMQENPADIATCTQLLFTAKNLERIGDRATNIAETVQFIISGSFLVPVRKKRDLPALGGDA
jgi:phosphate transport system protein